MALTGDWKSQQFLLCRQMPRFLCSPSPPRPPTPTFLIIWAFGLAQSVHCRSDSRLVLSCSTEHLQSAQTLFLQGRVSPMPGLQSPRQALTANSFWEDISFPGPRNPLWQNSGTERQVSGLGSHTELSCSMIPFYLPEPVLLTCK